MLHSKKGRKSQGNKAPAPRSCFISLLLYQRSPSHTRTTSPHYDTVLSSMATLSINLIFIFFLFCAFDIVGKTIVLLVEADWCVARSDASYQALQMALDYACAAGADCTQIESNGLCFLPNTIQAHASYAFNSYFQRKGMAAGSCDFGGTANIAKTDPSYGSCVYPSSMSAAGGTTTGTTPTTTNNTNTPTTTYGDGIAGLNHGPTPPLPSDNSKASLGSMVAMILIPFLSLFVISFAL